MPDSPSTGPVPFGLTSAVTAGDSASLLLTESLIHGLIARSILTIEEAIEIIDIAAEVERAVHDEKDVPVAAFKSLLEPLSRSLRVDLNS